LKLNIVFYLYYYVGFIIH